MALGLFARHRLAGEAMPMTLAPSPPWRRQPSPPPAPTGDAPSPLAVALDYIERGWSPIPIGFRSKAPSLPGWTDLRISADEASRYFNGAPANIGVVLGQNSSGLSDVDLDCPEAIAAAPYFLPKTAAIFGRETARASHWLYYTNSASVNLSANVYFDDPIAKERGAKARLVDLRLGPKVQTVFPGSAHEDTSEPIAWEPGCDGEPARVECDDLLRRVERLAACSLLARHWPAHGARHDARLAVAGVLVRAGFSESESKLFAEALARAVGDEDARDFAAAIRSTYARASSGEKFSGLPRACDVFGDAIGRAVADWLRLDESGADFGSTGHLGPKPRATIVQDGVTADAETGEILSQPADPLAGVCFDGATKLEPPPQLVKRLLPLRGVTFLGGQSGAGKTFIAVDLATSLGSGEPFFGHKVAERVGVVFLAAEGAATLAARIHVARQQKTTGEPLPIAWIDGVGNLSDSRDLNAAIAKLRAVAERMNTDHGVRLGAVVIDTLGAAFAMQDENASAEANRIIAAMRRIGDAVGAVVIPVHHFGKATDTGLRGASAWRGGADAILSVLANRNEVTGKVSDRRLALAKSRVGEEGEISAFELRFVELGADEDGEPYGACYVEPTQAADRVETAPRMTRPARAYLSALQIAVGDKGETTRPFGMDGPEVRAAEREDVRREFYAAWPADGDTVEKQQAAKQKAFRRGEAELLTGHAIAVRDDGARTLVWQVSDDE
ncbi:AAA family ATPase [Methylocystis sp. ATCC 49242]|uniref:AAA family ATPase n=1 Tax=Methylocystis sp. ATCC 49242 TaxID=622637 RepID=UPI0009FDBBD1|nr:AAA family ATPase [Methylocystis sp. ATCC 49242]